MKIIHVSMIYISFLLHFPLFSIQKAIINVPIADLIGQQITTIIPDASAEHSYASIAVCKGHIPSAIACPRLHQLLYNDIVEVISTTEEEMCIQITHAYYLIPQTTTPQNVYWTLKKNLTLLDDLTAHGIALSHIPAPIDFSDKNHSNLKNPTIVTLIEPHKDSTTNMTLSAGTRLVKVPPSHKKKTSAIEVFAIDYVHMKLHTIKIPYHKCVIFDTTKTKDERITDFVSLLKKWSHPKQGVIAYVWGGTSFTQPIQSNFKEVIKTGHNGDYSFFEYEKDTRSPKNGFDCSGVVLRAAQICGIPYFCKNTTTIAQCLSPLTPDQPLQAGDLILIKGHVMIVSDITKNLLIEARSYGHGYGKLHEIPINQMFEGINTYGDLMNTYLRKKSVNVKDKDGKVRGTFSMVQLFSMKSTWNND